MKLSLKWVYNSAFYKNVESSNSVGKNTYILYLDVPNKVDLKWKIALTKQIEPYCRNDRKCKATFNGQNYDLSARSAKNLVSNLAKIIIDNNKQKTGKLNLGVISENYVKY